MYAVAFDLVVADKVNTRKLRIIKAPALKVKGVVNK